ncbi:hypothetical protein RclHR1_16130005 [Rhizophagus clarus]|uniref:Uncharacterized protein n=1 Tax=Rhizophagus clarus TaxID=94130 RepID=A0A2Z6QL61_9GLOM|nr:hypothetical protein RclHR1_16130005 [Rhizophagus clarus]
MLFVTLLKNNPQVVVPVKKLTVTILAPSIAAPNTSIQLNTQGSSARGPSITVKKEIITSNAKLTLEEELAIAKKTALALNLEFKCSFASNLFAEKKNSPLKNGINRTLNNIYSI